MPEPGRIPVPLRLCRGCHRFVRIENEDCDFCGADLAALEAAHAAGLEEVRAATAALRAALAGRPPLVGGERASETHRDDLGNPASAVE